ncbi:SusC/RagA family TonB-linked outer membrane protein [Spirosoma oryzicola]|uniref:SusC/RagA family TonB-linked outer membrane protein n=1 Tax=Spirosoma oryzicola TaxID=2898794 RepID=UPI001E6175FB|nr:TonB-dependent receptor [Spirosoma oryzicola]UHG90204.1 TonB-dependent receptor [Spirosoma oryzicola]
MNTNFYKTFQFLLLWGSVLLWGTTVFAQNRRITGTVSSNTDPVPGANVVIKGTTIGTSTDANGAFTLSVRGADDVLTISAIGFKSTQVTVGSQTAVAIQLEEESSTLNEVVVTGYTTDSKRDNTGAVATVKARDLAAIPSANVETQLQGRVAGVTVIASGQPGASNTIRVRGFGAFGGNQPLYVVDGVPTQGSGFISPDDIESTTVLKDAAAASIYGARAANGVIVITTKKGQRRAQKLSVSYDGLYGVTDPGHAPALLTPQEQADWTWNAIRNRRVANGETIGPDSFTGIAGGQYGSGTTPVLPEYIQVGNRFGVTGGVDLNAERAKYNIDPSLGAVYQVTRANKEGTDWYKAITRVPILMRHTLGFSGGSESGRYYVSVSQQSQPGIILNNNFARYTFRVNSDFDVLKNKKLRFGENLQATYIDNTGQFGGTNGQNASQEENDILLAFRMAPIVPVYDVFGGYAGTAAKGFNNPSNPRANRDAAKNNRNFNVSLFGNAYLEYDIIPDLTVRSSIGGVLSNYYNKTTSRNTYENAEGNNGGFRINEGAGYTIAWTFTNTAQYKRTFGIHHLDVLAGLEALNDGFGRNISGVGLNPFSTDPAYASITTSQASGRQSNSDLFSGVNFYSQFGRVNYSLMDKYIVTAVVRRDGSSRFGASNRYGVFPAFSAAWRLSGEDFMKNLPFITDLKVRGGWGQMGNSNNVNPNNQYSLFQSNIANSYDISGGNSGVDPGFFRSRIGNPNAKWETSTTTNIGIDGSFFNGKLDVVFDVWRKDTKDLLYQVPIAGVVGVRATAPSVNIASMRNQGIDIQLITRGKVANDLGYEVDVNGSFLSNKILTLAPGVPYFDVSPPTNRLSLPMTRNQPGQSIASFFGYKVLGLFNTQEEINAAPKQEGAGLGRFRYADVDGNGVIDNNDRTFIGSPVPKFTGGMNLRLTYKGFDLATYLYTSLGGKIFNMSKWYTDFYPSFSGAAVSARVKNSWTPTNTNTTQPIFEDVANLSTNTVPNSFYVENGSFLRMQNITLGYTLPATLLNKVNLSRVRISLAANNVFTVTGYKGLDPGVGGAADQNLGVDIGNYPITRSYNVGLNIGF